jgi:hypothetical protein
LGQGTRRGKGDRSYTVLAINHVKCFLDFQPGKKQLVEYSVIYNRRKVGPELNTEKKREPL